MQIQARQHRRAQGRVRVVDDVIQNKVVRAFTHHSGVQKMLCPGALRRLDCSEQFDTLRRCYLGSEGLEQPLHRMLKV